MLTWPFLAIICQIIHSALFKKFSFFLNVWKRIWQDPTTWFSEKIFISTRCIAYMVSCPTWSKNIERTLVYSTHVEKSTFNLAWLTDIMGQTSGEGCIYIFRNSHKICIPLGQSKMLILLWQVLPSIKWNLLGQSLLWKNLHEQSLLAQ